MAAIGKSLMFYLKYYSEMTQLYEEEKSLPEVEHHADLELIKKKVNAVGDAACIEAATLLEACVSDLQARLATIESLKLKSPKTSTVQKSWQLKLDLRTPSKDEEGKYVRQIGIYLDNGGLFPWVWCRGGLEAEEKIISCFPQGVECSSSRKMGWGGGGTVGLATVPVPWESAKDFNLEADDIIKRARKVFEDAITRKFLDKYMTLG